MISYAVKQPLQYNSGFQPFPEVEDYGEGPAHESSGCRNPCSQSCTGELKIIVDRSICVNSVHCLDPLCSVLQKLEVVQVTTAHA